MLIPLWASNASASSRKLYLKLLRDFHRDYPAAVRTIREAIVGKRNEEALRLAPYVEGVYREVLGAMDLYTAAEEVETALKAGDSGRALGCLPGVEAQLQTVISGLGALAETVAKVPVAGASAGVDHEALSAAMKVLADLLRKNNPEAEVALESVNALCLGQWTREQPANSATRRGLSGYIRL